MSRSSQPYFRQQKHVPKTGSFNAVRGIFANALEHHQQGRLAEAERLYRQILALDPRHSDSLHLLGAIAHQVGRDEVAVELIGAAIALDKRQAAYHSNMGASLQALGRFNEAADSYQRAIELMPELAEAQMNLGAVLEAQGKHELAEARFRKAIELKPELAEAHVNLGNVLQVLGKLDEAVASHQRALALKPNFAEANFNYANALQAQGRLDDAVVSYQRALALKPDVAAYYGNLGNTLLAQGKLNDAEACYARALSIQPDYAEVWYNLGNARQAQPPERLGKFEEAEACYQRAIQLNPQLPEAHYNLGNTLHTLDKLSAAEASFERALKFRPTYAEAHYNLGCVLEDLDRLDEAIAHMNRALELKPDYPQARFGQALAQLRSGDFATGWQSYESRWQSPDHDTPWRAYAQPRWSGEKLSAGRLLLWGEQGVGDEIQFAGLLPETIRTGNRIVLDCDARLKPLFARSFPEIEVVSGYGPDESQAHDFAAQLPVGSLPALYRTSEAAFTATVSPYLKPDPTFREQFRTCYGSQQRVIGLAWYTKNQKTGHKRSLDLSLLAPLFALPGIRWVSLQYGDFDALESQAAAAGAPILIDRTVDQLADMDRFAAQVAAMDQVITIDNSTAHLAGALGLPVSLLLPFAADWRWMERRPDTPWYPTLRLFRQTARGDWDSVLDQVRNELASSLDGR
jgi:tetratricopeptide (TPR) repeat protein